MNPHLKGLFEFHAYQRRRIRERFAANDRRRARMAVGVTNDIDEPLTALSDDLSAFSIEVRTS
jgi:hypothetical protein